MAKRAQYTKEFKVEAVRLWKSSGRPAAAVARELGLRRNHLYNWQHELEHFGAAAFPGKGGRTHGSGESRIAKPSQAAMSHRVGREPDVTDGLRHFIG